MALPTSWTTTKLCRVTSPVSGSTSIRASWAQNAGACTEKAGWLVPRTGSTLDM